MRNYQMRPLGEIYRIANEEFLFPPPAMKLPDWKFFNEATGGLRMHEYTVLCGATGVGKTTWLANLSAQLLLLRIPHFVASVETGPSDFVKRLVSALVREDLNTGEKVSADCLRRIDQSYGSILRSQDIWLSLYNSKISAETLAEDLHKAHTGHGCQVAIFDNMNYFLEVTRAQDSIIELDRATRVFVDFVRAVPVHVLMVMHPKKSDGGRVESEFDVKGSSTAVQEADNVFLLNRPSDKDQMNFPKETYRELKIVKLRKRGKYVYRRIMYRNLDSHYHEESFL